jgi:DMSO/TMAO reductase YedYZ molybdopterin-dependent catalytic subunit
MKISALNIFRICFLFVVLISACRNKIDNFEEVKDNNPVFLRDTIITGSFPSYVTPTISFFVFSNNAIPAINEFDYRLNVHGAINQEKSFTLKELHEREMINKTVTIECIGNEVNGKLIGNALWTGISIFELINELGLKQGAVAIKYICKDGYFMTNTIEELKNGNVIGALYMNLEPLPVKFGFPLKIIFPGFHGVRQPGWVTDIEVLDTEPADYWSGSFWKSKYPIGVDSKLFYPLEQTNIPIGKTVQIAGAAYGARQISKVELTIDNGITWNMAEITKKSEEEFVWVFWKYNFKPVVQGDYLVQVRATDIDGKVQLKNDKDANDGNNSWPSVMINAK